MNADTLFVDADAGIAQITYEDARRALSFCDSYTRLPELLDMEWRMDSDDFLRLLGGDWSGYDNVSQHVDELLSSRFGELIEAGELPVWEMMTPDEQATYGALPHVVTAFRGCYAANEQGLSWSLDKAVAERFPSLLRYRQPGQAILVTARVEKKNIIALKLDRNEAEIITYMPKHVSTCHIKGGRSDTSSCRQERTVAPADGPLVHAIPLIKYALSENESPMSQ